MASKSLAWISRLKGSHKILAWLYAWQIRRNAKKQVKRIKKKLKAS